MFRTITIGFLAVTMSVSLSHAQMRGAGHASFAHTSSARGASSGDHSGSRRGVHRRSSGALSGYPFYSDAFFDGYDQSSTNTGADSPPPLIITRPDDSSLSSKPRPLLIELRGDRYVRFGGIPQEARSQRQEKAKEIEIEEKETSPAESLQGSAVDAHRNPAAAKPRPTQPAILVYRDGHRQEITSYSITNGVIYLEKNSWQSGAGTEKIPLAALDGPATMQANQRRGSTLSLPSSPNEVIAAF